jgi:hypothetical protein
VLGPDHPDTLTGLNNLAACLLAPGDASAALPLSRRAADGFDHKLGPDHPLTRIAKAKYEQVLREIG